MDKERIEEAAKYLETVLGKQITDFHADLKNGQLLCEYKIKYFRD